MKKILVFMLTVASLVTLASLVKSDEAAKGIAYIEDDSSGSSAADYIQDGLIAIWDAKDNAGWGRHNPALTGITELISGRVVEVEEIGDDYAVLKANNGYQGSYMARPDAVTIEFCGCLVGSGWGQQGNPAFNPIWSLNYNGAGYFAGRAFATSSQWKGNGWIELWREVLSDGVIRLSCDGTTTTLSVGNGESRRSFSQGFGDIKVVNFCTRAKLSGYPDVFHCVRVYNRILTDEEMVHNYAVDVMRFYSEEE